MIASGSMKRRISHADARRSTKSGVRVAHARRKYRRLERATPASGERGASSGKIIAAAAQVYPDNLGVLYEYAEVLQSVGNPARAIDVLQAILKQRPQDARAYNMIAKSYAALGRRTDQHRALAEGYYLQGSLAAAVDQLALAQKAGDGDFYTLSAIDARLRELRKLQQDEIKDRKK